MATYADNKNWQRVLNISRVLLLTAFFFSMLDVLFQVFLYSSMVLFSIYFFGQEGTKINRFIKKTFYY